MYYHYTDKLCEIPDWRASLVILMQMQQIVNSQRSKSNIVKASHDGRNLTSSDNNKSLIPTTKFKINVYYSNKAIKRDHQS